MKNKDDECQLMREGSVLQVDVSSNYLAWLYNCIAPFIGKRILEVGTGYGYYAERINNYDLYCATDVDEIFLRNVAGRLQKKPNMIFARYDAEEDTTCELRSHNFDTIICMGVIEHIKNDQKALANMGQLLVPGGRLIIFTPALPGLYGESDSSIGHYRRYGKRELEQKLIGAGFRVEKNMYHNFVGIFAWFLNSRILRKKAATGGQLSLFDKIVPGLEFCEKLVKPCIGLNFICVGQK